LLSILMLFTLTDDTLWEGMTTVLPSSKVGPPSLSPLPPPPPSTTATDRQAFTTYTFLIPSARDGKGVKVCSVPSKTRPSVVVRMTA